jgi:predicted nucleic acid-binding protein
MDTLTLLETEGIVQPMNVISYGALEEEAKERITARDPNDWPLVAVALLLGCPIWTEDKDFFGTGIAVWNTANVEIYLKMSKTKQQRICRNYVTYTLGGICEVSIRR